MKTLVSFLIIAAFLQTTILPVNLVLIILICRSYLKIDKVNLILGFWFGLLVSFLSITPLGLQGLLYLIFIAISQSLSKIRLAGNPLLIIPLTLFFLSLDQIAFLLVNHEPLKLPLGLVLESLLSLPVLYLLKIWEERFIVKKEIKLKF